MSTFFKKRKKKEKSFWGLKTTSFKMIANSSEIL